MAARAAGVTVVAMAVVATVVAMVEEVMAAKTEAAVMVVATAEATAEGQVAEMAVEKVAVAMVVATAVVATVVVMVAPSSADRSLCNPCLNDMPQETHRPVAPIQPLHPRKAHCSPRLCRPRRKSSRKA